MSRPRYGVVAWTGHRPDLFRDPAAAQLAVEAAGRELVKAGATRFLVGGQRGVDTWAAYAAKAMAVPFTLVLPLPVDEFARDWSEIDRSVLLHAVASAADVRIAGTYAARNQILAREADLLVAVWTCTLGGGTAETLEYARQFGTPIRELRLEPSATAESATGRGI